MLSAPWIAEFWRELNELERMLTQHDVDIKRLWRHQHWGDGWPVGGIPPLSGGTTTTTTTTTSTTTTTTTSTTPDWEYCGGGCCPGTVILEAGDFSGADDPEDPGCCVKYGGTHVLTGGCFDEFSKECRYEVFGDVGCCVSGTPIWRVVVSAGGFISATICTGTPLYSTYTGGFITAPCEAGTITLTKATTGSVGCGAPETITVTFS